MSSGEEPLVPTMRFSDFHRFHSAFQFPCFGARRHSSISLVRGTHHPSQFPSLEEAGVQDALTAVDPPSVGPSAVMERIGGHSQERVAVLAMDADDSDVAEGSQHELLMEAREGSRRTRNRSGCG